MKRARAQAFRRFRRQAAARRPPELPAITAGYVGILCLFWISLVVHVTSVFPAVTLPPAALVLERPEY